MEKQSARLAVSSNSYTVSFIPNTSFTSRPIGVFSGKIYIPCASSGNTKSLEIPNSATEQNIPSEVTPRNLPFLISVPSAKRDLWYATGTI